MVVAPAAEMIMVLCFPYPGGVKKAPDVPDRARATGHLACV